MTPKEGTVNCDGGAGTDKTRKAHSAVMHSVWSNYSQFVRKVQELQVMSEGLKSTYDAMVMSEEDGEEQVENMSWLPVMYGVAFLDQPVLPNPRNWYCGT